jgi:hypothetical protein
MMERSRIEYDNNSCGEVPNINHYEYQELVCDYCIPDWQAYNTTCSSGILTQYYEDSNSCFAQTGLNSDLSDRPNNITASCGTCNSNSDCGDDGYIDGTYCLSDDVYQTYRDWTCHDAGTADSYCSYDDIEGLIEGCNYGCVNGECVEPNCTVDSDCGIDNWIGSPYCDVDDVWQTQGTWNCNVGSCEYSENDELKESCSDSCSNGVCVEVDRPVDLKAEGFVVQYPSNPMAGLVTIFAFNLENIGDIETEAKWEIDTGEEVISGADILKPGEGKIIVRKTTYSTAGNYNANVMVDPNGDVDESDESNNQKNIIVEVD